MKTRKINYRKVVIFVILIIFVLCLFGVLFIDGRRHAEKVALRNKETQKIEKLETKDVSK